MICSKGGLRIVDDDTIVKFGSLLRIEEAETMDFLSTRTNIKCPTVRGAYTLDGVTYIIMSRERGTMLRNWWDTATHDAREDVIAQLQRYTQEMRSIKGDYVGGWGRSGCITGEFLWDSHSRKHQYGPYADEDAFNGGICEAMNRVHPGQPPSEPECYWANQRYARHQMVRSLRGHEIVFTHGDLIASKIMIREEDGQVVLLDWDTAGFYPEYWECYKATWRGVFRPDFIRQVERFLKPFWIEANIMEQIYRRILG